MIIMKYSHCHRILS